MFALLLLQLLSVCVTIAAGSVGVNYGRVANNLPQPEQVVELLQDTSIKKVKLFDADSSVLAAFSGSRFEVVVGFPNERIRNAAVKQHFATKWIRQNILPFVRPKSGKPATKITAISVGNEVFAPSTSGNSNNSRKGSSLGSLLLPAMKNLHAALVYHNLDAQVKLSSPMPLSVLSVSYPPSSGAFRADIASSFMKPFLDFLAETGSHLMVNAYPFFAYESNSATIPLDYALFRPNAGVRDPQTGLLYTNLLDAQLDAVYTAMQALGHREVAVVVSETGWPNSGDSSEVGASVSNAAAYNGNLVKHLGSNVGTPLRPNVPIEAFIFALFNENEKPGPSSERNYGLFYPDRSIVYDCGLLPRGSAVRRSRPSNSSSSPPARKPSTSGKTWCVAKTGMNPSNLQLALDYACGKADCTAIQSGHACYLPDTVEAHASYAMNSYYQKNMKAGGTCDFAGSGTLTSSNPSYGSCQFPLL